MTQLAHPDLNALLRDRTCFAARAVELGWRFGRLPARFADTLAAFLRLRSMEFAGRQRTGISLGRDGIRKGIEHAFTCFDLGLEQESGADVERAVELLAEPDFPGLCRKGYETAFRRLREMRRESDALCGLPHSELLPEFAARLETWKRITPETFVSSDVDGCAVDVDPRVDYALFEETAARLRLVCSLPHAAMQSARAQGLADFDPILRRLVAAVAMSAETLEMDKAALRDFRKLHFAGGGMLTESRLRVEREIEAHLESNAPRAREFLLREVGAIIAELGASSGDEERFAAAVRGDLTPESKLAAKSAFADIAETSGPESPHRWSERMKPVSVEDLERVARLYKSNKEASAALGIHPRSFARLCRKHGIPTPYVRRRRARADCRRG